MLTTKSTPSKTNPAVHGTPFLGRAETNGATRATVPNVVDMVSTKPVANRASKQKYGAMLASKDLIGLYQSIEAALPNQESRVIQLASCNKGEGTTAIGFGLSSITAGVLGQRTLFIDIHANSSEVGAMRKNTMASLIDVAGGRAIITNAVTMPSGGAMPFDYAYLSSENTPHDILAHQEKIKQILDMLKSQYRLIVFHVSDVLSDPLGVALSSLADGVVLVVEANRTRAPAAKEAISLLSRKGANILGLAFNKRRFYIPRWLYRRL